MDWLEFAASIVRSIAWPSVIVAVLVIFRRDLRLRLRSLARLRYKDFDAEFAKLEENVAALPQEPAPKPSFPPPRTAEEVLETLVQVSPRAAVVEAFALVERAARDAAARHGLEGRGVMSTMRELARRRPIPDNVMTLFDDLRSIRNKLAQAQEDDISEWQAWRYIDAARTLAARLNEF